MLEAQSGGGNLRHRIIAVDEELEVYVAVLHRLVDKVGPLLVSSPRETENDRFYADGGVKVLSQEHGIE